MNNNARNPSADLAKEMVFKMAIERIDVAVDWRALFQEFCNQHGGDPVFWEGRLLFQDGWTHSAESHGGPSWPAPTEPLELRAVMLIYWTERRKMVQGELDRLEHMVQQLSTLSQVRGVKVPIKIRHVDQGKFKLSDEVFDANTFQVQRMAWLKGDLALCDEKLKELRNVVAAHDPRNAVQHGEGVVEDIQDGKGS